MAREFQPLGRLITRPLSRGGAPLTPYPLFKMSNLHPATAPHIRRAIARRERRAAFARVSMFSASAAVCLFSIFPLVSIAQDKEDKFQAMAAAAIMGCAFTGAASLVAAAGSASEA